jgi:hypothetical protein
MLRVLPNLEEFHYLFLLLINICQNLNCWVLRKCCIKPFSFRELLNLGGGAYSASDGNEVFYSLIISGSGLNKNTSLHSCWNEILR